MHQTINTLDRLREIVTVTLFEDTKTWNTINALCRKIDVAQKLLDLYDENWKSVSKAQVLEAPQLKTFCELWQALIERGIASSTISSGRKLKLINSGLKVTDIWQRAGGSSSEAQHIREVLLQYAERIVHD